MVHLISFFNITRCQYYLIDDADCYLLSFLQNYDSFQMYFYILISKLFLFFYYYIPEIFMQHRHLNTEFSKDY